MSDAELARLREVAIRLLARREHSRRELAVKLRQRGGATEHIEGTLDALESERLLSDRRFAEEFVRVRRERGQGPVRILAELSERGVDQSLARELLHAEPDHWLERARALRDRRFGGTLPASRREWLRQAGFLSRQGYTSEQVHAVLGDEQRGAGPPSGLSE